MSPIQVLLENASLGDQKVGTNRKPIWDDQTDDCTSFLAKFAAFGHTNAMMVKSAQSTSGQYLMFKKMHHIRWNGTIDLTHSIQIRQNRQVKDQEAVNNWFNDVLLKDDNGNAQRLYYKNADDEVIQIVGFGKEVIILLKDMLDRILKYSTILMMKVIIIIKNLKEVIQLIVYLNCIKH